MLSKEILYSMKLNEQISDNHSITIIRVPGGWIYIIIKNNVSNTVFVPFNNEFM